MVFSYLKSKLPIFCQAVHSEEIVSQKSLVSKIIRRFELKNSLILTLDKVKVQLFPVLPYDHETGGLNICEDSISVWNRLLQLSKMELFCRSVILTRYATQLERIPYSKRYHWVLGPPEVSEPFVRQMGDMMLEKLEEKYKDSIVPPNSPQSIRVKSILKEIVEAMHSGLKVPNSGKWSTRFSTEHLDGMKWDVMVVDSKDDFAGCLSNGTIVVFTRIFEILQSDAEVATVLAHEVGHGLARHRLEDITRCLRTVATLPLLMFIPYSEIPVALVFSFMSRRREMEADYIGMMLMASAGYDPQLAPLVFESRLDPSGSHGLFASHPSGRKRAKKLKEPKVMEQAMAIYGEVTSGQGVRSFI